MRCWLVFLFPAPAEGQSTSGAGSKRKRRPFQVEAAVVKPRNQTNQFGACRQSSYCRRRTCFLPGALFGGVRRWRFSRRQRLNFQRAWFTCSLTPLLPSSPHRCNFQAAANLLSLWRLQVCPRAVFSQWRSRRNLPPPTPPIPQLPPHRFAHLRPPHQPPRYLVVCVCVCYDVSSGFCGNDLCCSYYDAGNS